MKTKCINLSNGYITIHRAYASTKCCWKYHTPNHKVMATSPFYASPKRCEAAAMKVMRECECIPMHSFIALLALGVILTTTITLIIQ